MSDTLDRLREMVSREKRATYDVGDWWNVADAAIEEIEQQARARVLLEQQIERLHTDYDISSDDYKQLVVDNERLRSAGVGYSQQTVDAITQEREKLRADRRELALVVQGQLETLMERDREIARLGELIAGADRVSNAFAETACKRGARLQLMKAWMLLEADDCDTWTQFVRAHPEAADWFYDDGAPR